MKQRILVIEDDEAKRTVLEDELARVGHEVRSTGDGLAGLELIRRKEWDVALVDMKLPGLDGMSILKAARELQPNMSVIMMTAFGSIETAVESMKLGAYDFLTKPFTSDELLLKIERLADYRSKVAENTALKRALASKYRFREIIGSSKPMQELLAQVAVVADSDAAVLIVGETGTGKELVAETIHYGSSRRPGPFVPVSCVTLRDSIIESELFGHEKGAFSGAIRTKAGRFELANGGTIFLDDIDDVPVAIQPKLLRVLQNKEFERVGGERSISVDVRVIAATKKDLWALVEKDEFREDLYYRLNTITLRLPPLRELREDIHLFVAHFVRMYDKRTGRRFSPEALGLLARYDWPGNVRELEHLVEAALVLARKDEVTPADLPRDFLAKVASQATLTSRDLKGDLADIERETISKALAAADGNVARAARQLGIARSTLRDRLKKLGIQG